VSLTAEFQNAEQLWEQAAQSLYSSGQITAAQLQKALSVTPVMAAIAGAESTFGANPVGDGGTSLGIWQIHVPAHPQYDPQSLLDSPFYNAAAAVQVYLSQGLGAWSTYKNGAYLAYMQNGAAAAIGAVTGNHPGSSTPAGPAPIAKPWSAQTAQTVAIVCVLMLGIGLLAAVNKA
jgi:hypothetical protein